MAIARNTVQDNTQGVSVSSITWNHNASGSNRVGLVSVQTFQSGVDTEVISGVTWAGNAMTQLTKVFLGTTTGQWEYIYGIIAPTTGSQAIVVSTSVSVSVLYGNSVSYTGVKQSGLPDVSTTGTGTGTSITKAITTITDNSIVIGAVTVSGGAQSAGAGATALDTLFLGNNQTYESSTFPITPAGSYSMTVNSVSTNLAICMIALAPFVVGANVGASLLMALI